MTNIDKEKNMLVEEKTIPESKTVNPFKDNRHTRRSFLKWSVIGRLSVTPIITYYFRKNTLNLPLQSEYEIFLTKPKNIVCGRFTPKNNLDYLKLLGLSTTQCGDADIIEVIFCEAIEDSYCARIDLRFDTPIPDPTKEYKFEFVAYDENGVGIGYATGTTKDLRTIDLNAEGKKSKSVLLQKMKVRPVYSLEIDFDRKTYDSLACLAIFCKVFSTEFWRVLPNR